MAARRLTQALMTQLPIQLPANSPRLVRYLAELVGADAAVSHRHFTQRLGQLFDLPDSISISAAHAKTPAVTQEPSTFSTREIKAEFLRARAALVSSALQGFEPGGRSVRLRFPLVTADMPLEQIMTPEPYLAFYAAQQRDIDFRIRNLQAATRDAVATVSPRLAQLAALDLALGDPLAAHHRHFFAAVCGLLKTRIERLFEEYRQSVSGNQDEDHLWANTVAQLRAEMQGLLLAEIGTRLEPALGLVEALDEHEEDE